MQEGVVEKPAKAKVKSKPWALIIILIIFLITIVGLVFFIIYNNNNTDNVEQEEIACEEMASERQIMSCLSHEEEGEELEQRYDEVLDKAFEEGEYEFFDDVILDRSENLVLKDECDKTLSWLESLESKYAKKLPVLELYGFYISGKEVALECDNSEKLTYYQNKIDATMNSDEYEKAVVNNDYRVYGVDILEESEYDEEGE